MCQQLVNTKPRIMITCPSTSTNNPVYPSKTCKHTHTQTRLIQIVYTNSLVKVLKCCGKRRNTRQTLTRFATRKPVPCVGRLSAAAAVAAACHFVRVQIMHDLVSAFDIKLTLSAHLRRRIPTVICTSYQTGAARLARRSNRATRQHHRHTQHETEQ